MGLYVWQKLIRQPFHGTAQNHIYRSIRRTILQRAPRHGLVVLGRKTVPHPGGRRGPRCIRHPRAGRPAVGVAPPPPSPSLTLAVPVPVPAQMKQYHSLHWVGIQVIDK